MANVVYRGKSITFPDGMSEAEIAQAMPSIADQIDTDFLNESSAQKTPEKKESFSDKAINTVKSGIDYLRGKDKEFAEAEQASIDKAFSKQDSLIKDNNSIAKTGFNYDKVENILPTVKADRETAARIKKIGIDINDGASPEVAAQNAIADKTIKAESEIEKFKEDAKQAQKNISSAENLKDKPKRSIGDVYGDMTNTALKVAPTALKGAVDVADLLTLSKVDLGVSKYLQKGLDGMDETFGSDTLNYEKQSFADIANSEDFGSGVKFFLRNPMYLVDQAGTSLGSAVLPAGVSASILKVAGAIKPSLSIAAARQIAGGSVAGTIALQNAASTFNSDELKGLPLDKRYEAAGMTAILTLATNKVFGGGLDKAIADKFGNIGTKQGLALALKEGGQEASESASQSFSVDAVAPEKMTFARGINQAATEGLLGTFAGGAFSLADRSANQKLTVSQGNPADDVTAAKLQAEFDAKQAQADTALAEITNPNISIEDSIKLAEQAVNTPASNSNDLALLNKINTATGVQEAIPASDILGDDNVSDTTNAATSVVAESTQSAGDNAQGSVADLPIQPNVSGVGDVAAAPASSEPGNVATGTGSDANDTLNRPFAQATDDFLPKMRSMTTDAKVISQIDEELKLRGIANVDGVNTPAERVDETAKGVHVGEKINKEWTAFSPESGTLNIPRSEMPQVKAEHRGAMVNFLNARGVDHTQETVPASSLKPTQQEFSEAKVKKASNYAGGDRSILVSSDNHVLDGHHQWLSKLNKGGDVDVIRLNAPITQLLNDVKEFPSSTVESGAAEAAKVADPKAVKPLNSKFNRYKSVEREYVEGETSPIAKIKNEVGQFVDSLTDEEYEKLAVMVAKEPYAPEQFKGRFDGIIGVISEPEKLLEQWGSFVKELRKGSTPKSVEPKQAKPKLAKTAKPKTLLATLRDIGGIKLSEKQDVTGEEKGFAPGGYNQVFKQASNRSLKGLIESGDLDEYLPYNMRLEANGMNDDAFDSTEAYDYLADKIRNGESVLPYAVEEEVKANQYYQEVEATAQDILDDFAKNFNEDEINAELQIAGTNEREAFTDVQVFNTDSENGDTGSGEREAATTETNASQQAEVKDSNTDLLGDNTTAKQAIADAERAKDAKRNSGNDNQDTFTLTGSNSEADQAAAAGAQDLFAAPMAQPEIAPKSERAIWIPNMTRGKLDKLLNKVALSESDVEALKDFKYFLINDKQSATDKGFYDELLTSGQKEPAYVLKDKFLLANIDNKLNEKTANQSSNGQANDEASEIEYNGVRLYKIKVRNRVEGQPPTEMWAVESIENKARKARGDRAIGGDNLSETLDEAKAEAELMLKREADNNQAADAQAKLEAEKKEQSRIDADKKADIDGFGSELNAMQLGKLKETLNKPTSINGVVSPLRDAVRNLVAKGGNPEIKEENVYKGMSRAQYNRADNRAQQEDEKRIREGGKKNVYYITMPDGGMFELGKTAHDFAEHLIAKAESKPQDEVAKATEALTAAGVKGKEKLDTIKDVREGKVTANEVADAYAEQPAKEDKPQTPLSLYDNAMDEYGQGVANVDDYKAAFNYVLNNEKSITEYLEANFTKPQLFKRARGSLESRYKSEKKDRVVRALYSDMVTDFLLPSESGMTSFSHGFGGDRYKDVIKQVEAITQESLDKAMDKQKQSIEKRAKAIEARNVGMQDPKTLDDYVSLLRSKMADGMPLQEARMSLTQEQRETYDLLSAETTMAARADRKETQQDTVRTAGQTVEGNIIETKHTKKGHDLFVVQLAERVSKEDYDTLNTGAKKLGGYYSSFKGQGAVVGFQFTSRENAEAFVQLAGGDSTSAKEQVKERRDAYEDDKSQTAVERLTEMADRLEDSANEDLSRDRKTNTSRRAGMAARAEAVASAQKAMAITMRNIANSIDTGKAKFLGKVRQKVQVELLQTIVANAQYKKLREQYPSYSEYEKHQHEPADKLTADYADFPHYTLNRSDWARLGRAMVDVDGFKALGTKILSVADDVTAEYLKFAKDNLTKVAMYRSQSGALSSFGTKKEAEYAISRSGFNGQAIALQVKRGEYLIIDSPQLAKERGNWVGDDDKRISLSADFINQVIEKVGKANRKSSKIALPWQLESAYDRRNKLKRMGIETPAELRAAIREFVQIKENVEPPSKVKELERKMVGRKGDGLDFFPTPASTSDEMIETADIREGMTVLEPSAGMGHIAERIRDAGFEPDVVEFSGDRRELLELKGFNVVGSDFLGVTEKYDRIIMNPPFSNRRDEEHVRHAYNLLKPNGKLVAIMGEGVFFGNDKRATEFRDWLESVGGTSEKLEEGTFKDASLPVNTGVNARMVVIEKQDAENGADSDNVPMFSRANQPAFYSALTRAIEEIKTNKADPRLWKGMIKNLAQKGVKPDEVEWTGVNEWLDLQTGVVTKEQVLEYLNANGVQVTETMLGDKPSTKITLEDIARDEELFNKYYDGKYTFDELNFSERVNLLESNYVSEQIEHDYDSSAETKYSQYTVPGGDNYKELLLTLPEKNAFSEQDREEMNRLATRMNNDINFSDAELKRYNELNKKSAQRIDSNFHSSHFDQPNILAHVRFDERTDADGNKVLFINEIQSDWGQDGKKKGFVSEYVTAKQDGENKWDVDGVKILFFEKGKDGKNYRTVNKNGEQEFFSSLKEANDVANERRKDVSGKYRLGIKPAPFVTKTDAWVGLAMKRMVRYAAENGFDKVALISGEQAADLYDLSKQVKSIYYSKNQDGTYDLDIMTKDDKDIRRSDLSENQLVDNVGKEIAEKIVNSESKSGSFTGLDLRVGGTGMVTFYNQIVPKVAKDVLKKVGGQVESINMQTVSDEEFEAVLDKAADNGEMITVGSDAYNALRYKQQVGFTITPEMREKVMGGLPLFNRETNIAKGLPKQAIQNAVNALRANWKNAPEIIVVQDMRDPAIRKAVRDENQRQLSQGAEGQPEGFFDAGKVYIVASEMNSADDVARVVFHETLGHYGLRGVYGDKLDRVLDSIYMARRQLVLAKATQYGLDFTKQSDRRIAAEEVLAEMAQTNPQAGFVQRAIAAIRQFLRDIGVKLELSDNDIIVNYLLPARNYVTQGAQQRGLVGNLSTAFNRDNSPTTAQLFKELTLNDDMFKYPKSNAVDMQEVFNEVAPGLLYIEKSKSFDDEVSELYSVYPIDASGNPIRSKVGFINVYDDGKVEINVSSLGEGFGGSRIYAAVGNWAYNNGKVFAGDREGISPAGISRRLENMISLALKFGTTDHIMPHKDQMNDLGFDWKDGDTEYNLAEMLKASFNAIRNGVYVTTDNFGIEVTEKSNDAKGVSKLDDLVYDFDKHQFTDLSNGKPYTTGDFDKLASTAEARAAYAGRTTLQRAALGNTFMGATREGKQFLLEQLGKLSLQPLQLTDPQLAGIFYSRSNPQSRLTPQWQVDETSKMDNVIRALQDKYIDLKRVTQEIKKAGNDISDRWNAYLQEELYHGRSAKRVQDFIKQDLTPLIEDMRMRGVGMADFEEYLWMRHAPERNEQIAKINPDMSDGGAGVTTEEAESYMDGLNPADKKKYEALAKRIDAITAKSRQVLVDYGLESQATVNAWQSAYEFYVPLMREDMERGTGNGTGSGFKVKGNSSKRAMGSNRAVVDVIANIAQQYEKNIVRGEKNRVATAMIGLAKLNPNEEFWNVETPPTIRHVSKATGLVETRTDPNYKNRNNVIVARIVNKRGEIEERSVTFNEFNDRAMKMALSLNNLDVDQVNAVTNFMGNITRYFSSINTQYNPIFGIVNITRDTQGAMLNLSTTELAGKQKEVLANIMPALRGIYAETRTDNGIKSPMQFGSFTAAQKSKAQAMRTLWEEYQREGGTTGFRDMYANAEERTKAVSKALDPNWWTKTLAGKVVTVGGVLTVPETALNDKLIKPMFDWLSDYNQTLENAVRLAAYKVAIDSGISKQQAASIGKNLTVNFNRKGAYTRTMGSWYAFFNAAVQGTARIGETLTGPKGKQIIAGGVSIGVAQAFMLAAMGFDDEEPKEFVRSTNFIIPAPGTDKGYVTIPMPLGFNVLPNFGRITTEWALSGAENTTKRVFDIFGAVMESFNPLGGNGRIDSIIMPTVADPFNDLSKNEDWTGRDIAQEDFNSLDPTPGYTRTRDKATEASIELARWINNLSGGDDYAQGNFSPTGDQIEYLVGQLTGGVGREVVKGVTTIESLFTGEDLPTYKIPLVGRFFGNSAGQAPQASEFYRNIMRLNELENGIIGRYKDGKDAESYMEKNPDWQHIDTGKETHLYVQDLKKQKRDLVQQGASREEVKLVDEQITQIMTEFNQTVKPETTNQ